MTRGLRAGSEVGRRPLPAAARPADRAPRCAASPRRRHARVSPAAEPASAPPPRLHTAHCNSHVTAARLAVSESSVGWVDPWLAATSPRTLSPISAFRASPVPALQFSNPFRTKILATALTTGVGGSPRPSQPRIQPTHQRRRDQGNGERRHRHSVPHTHS